MSLVIEGFAGPGGWSEGLKLAGFTGTAVGIEWDWSACKTAKAAGHLRVQADVATYPLEHLAGKVDGLIQSPPCQAWSMAGDRKGEVDRPAVFARIATFANGREPEVHEWADERSFLTAEPMRYAVALRPRWIALEQVPAVLPLWQYMGELLRGMGYKVWTGVLSAEEYGVPQTRKRAILVARNDGLSVGPPEPTHQPYRAGQEARSAPDLFGDPLPLPVSMADALGWNETATVEYQRGKGMAERHGERPHRPAPAPAPAPTIRAGSGGVGTNLLVHDVVLQSAARTKKQDGTLPRSVEHPAMTIAFGHADMQWSMRNGNQQNACERRACERRACEPAGTLFFGERTNAVDWVHTRLATTVCGDARIAPPGHRDREGGERQFAEDTRRVTVQEAAVLQSFRPDYPWFGTKSQQYQQVGNAVPPLLAAAVLRQFFATEANREAA